MKTKRSDLAREFIENALFRIEENMRMLQKSLDFLKEEEVWKRPNETSNSVGNILVHLRGNITQYILAGLGGAEDLRERDAEFAVQGGLSKRELMEQIHALMQEVKSALKNLSDEQLTNYYKVQGFDLSGAGIVLHVVEHFSYHTGQIAFWTKSLKNRDLGFYEGVDLNIKNKNGC
ncbi:DinB family protein [Muriicola sp.]|uniref:DinB family protein n=2 Tax=Muriicola sp. TaxID=2020856 RepID=UPI003564120B